MQIDLCVFLAGNNLDAYTPIFFETLYGICDTSNLCIHVVEKGSFNPGAPVEGGTYIPDMKDYVPGVGDNIHQYLLDLKALGAPVTIYEKHDPREFFQQATPRETCYDLVSDHANTLNWAMANCGTNKWVLFCHTDIVFVKDIVSRLMVDMNDHTGMIGVFELGYLAVNREAYRKIGVGFNSISAFFVLENKCDPVTYAVKHLNDPDCDDHSKPIHGWDTGELLKLIMVANGWRCPLNLSEETLSYVYHGGSGHGYLRNLAQVEFINNRADEILEKLGLGRL